MEPGESQGLLDAHGISALADDLLVQILKGVSVRGCHTHWLVCRRWADLAPMATEHMRVGAGAELFPQQPVDFVKGLPSLTSLTLERHSLTQNSWDSLLPLPHAAPKLRRLTVSQDAVRDGEQVCWSMWEGELPWTFTTFKFLPQNRIWWREDAAFEKLKSVAVEVEVSSSAPSIISSLSLLPRLQHLHVSCCALEDLPLELGSLEGLVSLHFSAPSLRVNTWGSQALVALTSLRSLSLQGLLVVPACITELVWLTRLELGCSILGWSMLVPPQHLSNLPSLKECHLRDLSYCEGMDEGSLGRVTHLQLSLRSNRASDAANLLLKCAASLRHLDVHYFETCERHVRCDLRGCESLKELRVSGKCVWSKFCQVHLDLRKLELVGVCFPFIPFKCLEHQWYGKGVKELRIKNVLIPASGFSLKLCLSELRGLEVLHLDGMWRTVPCTRHGFSPFLLHPSFFEGWGLSLKSLKLSNLYWNAGVSLQGIGTLTALEELEMAKNDEVKFSLRPSGSLLPVEGESLSEDLGSLTRLRLLILNKVHVREFPRSLVNSETLKDLVLEGMGSSDVEEVFRGMPLSLERVTLSSIQDLEAIPAGLVLLKKLRRLELSGLPQLETMAGNVLECWPSLCRLRVRGVPKWREVQADGDPFVFDGE